MKTSGRWPGYFALAFFIRKYFRQWGWGGLWARDAGVRSLVDEMRPQVAPGGASAKGERLHEAYPPLPRDCRTWDKDERYVLKRKYGSV
jgi:hypothetical protein